VVVVVEESKLPRSFGLLTMSTLISCGLVIVGAGAVVELVRFATGVKGAIVDEVAVGVVDVTEGVVVVAVAGWLLVTFTAVCSDDPRDLG
jgi:hypothetical protein